MSINFFEVKKSYESRDPIVSIGSRSAFGAGSAVSVSESSRSTGRYPHLQHHKGVLTIAALFHDLGKASVLFQKKLREGLKGADPIADAVRHELISATVFDQAYGDLDDGPLIRKFCSFDPSHIDDSWSAAATRLEAASLSPKPDYRVPMKFAERPGSIAFWIGTLILTHHRLPTEMGRKGVRSGLHSRHGERFSKGDICPAPGDPMWRDPSFSAIVRKVGANLAEGGSEGGAYDLLLRTCLMLGDHTGSSMKVPSPNIPDHLANTLRQKAGDKPIPADDLLTHTMRVTRCAVKAFNATLGGGNAWPSLSEDKAPVSIVGEGTADPRFSWQNAAMKRAREVASGGGGFFACLKAGTGTGKTRGAPAILAAATFSDPAPERRGLRYVLGLGLRALATQSAKEYVSDMGFDPDDLAVMIGTPPIDMGEERRSVSDAMTGSESLHDGAPSWFETSSVPGGKVPEHGSPDEHDWIRGLSLNTDKRLPEILERYAQASRDGASGTRLLSFPVICATIDQIASSAAPRRSFHLFPSLRVMTSDLIIDEIDQFSPEDFAVIRRICWQVGASGRRLVISSATISRDAAMMIYSAYRSGWSEWAGFSGAHDRVGCVVTGDGDDTAMRGENFEQVFDAATTAQDARSACQPPKRIATVMALVKSFDDLPHQVSKACSELHDAHHETAGGKRYSFGFVRMSRVAHAVNMTRHIGGGEISPGRWRSLICLHSRFPSLHRAWIEDWLKTALTRKGESPNAAAERALLDINIPDGMRDIEVVLISTQVIETGNDLDFDWCVIDPGESRAIVQAAGRVMRHRSGEVVSANVALLGCPAVTLEGSGKLSRPGVETRPHDDTRVSRPVLSRWEGTSDLTGFGEGVVITAAFMNSGNSPLRNAEESLLKAYADDDKGWKYAASVTERIAVRSLSSRVLRRSSAFETNLYVPHGEEIGSGVWIRYRVKPSLSNIARNTKNSDGSIVGAAFPDLPRKARDAVDPERTAGDDKVRVWSMIRVRADPQDESELPGIVHPITGHSKE